MIQTSDSVFNIQESRYDFLKALLGHPDGINLPVLAVRGLSGVHLVDTNDKLLHSKSVGKQSVFSGLSVLGDTGLELTST